MKEESDLTVGDSDNAISALNTHGQTGSEATSADSSGPANREAVAKNVLARRQEAERPTVKTQVAGPRHGVTVRAHVEGSLSRMATTVLLADDEIRHKRRLSKARREQLFREFAGVQAECETVKLWLSAGCPEG